MPFKLLASSKNVTMTIFTMLITFMIGIWLYAAHCFEKHITKTHEWLFKTGHITLNDIHINKYVFTARFNKPIINMSVNGLDLNYVAGDHIQFSYQILTKTLTIQTVGDETLLISKAGSSYPLATLSKKDNLNNNQYSVRFSKFIPMFANADTATLFLNATQIIKSVRLNCKNSNIKINDAGTFTAKLIKYTAEPRIKKDTPDTLSLHIHDQYVFDEFEYTAINDAPQTLGKVSLPKTGKSNSHITVHLGNKSETDTHRIINEFGADGNWVKLLEALSIHSKNEGKQTFEGLSRSSLSDITYAGAKKEIKLHIDFSDTYDASWKQEYLPFLQLVSVLTDSSGEKKDDKDATDKKLLALLPSLENHNPIKKTADIHITFNDTHMNTKIGFGYNIAQHGVQLNVELPLKKNTLWDLTKQIDTFMDQELGTYIDGSIKAILILDNSKAILDDIEDILVRCQETFNDPKLFGNLATNRQLADMALTTFGQKLDDKQLKIQVSYDAKLQKINYDTARNVGDIMTKLLPMIFGGDDGHDHAHNHAH